MHICSVLYLHLIKDVFNWLLYLLPDVNVSCGQCHWTVNWGGNGSEGVVGSLWINRVPSDDHLDWNQKCLNAGQKLYGVFGAS